MNRNFFFVQCFLLIWGTTTLSCPASAAQVKTALTWETCIKLDTIVTTKGVCYVKNLQGSAGHWEITIGVEVNINAGTVTIGGSASSILPHVDADGPVLQLVIPDFPFAGCVVIMAEHDEHMEFVEDYVAAKLRERKPHEHYRNKTMSSRLPTWIKLAKNRDAVLKCISELKKQI